MTSEDGRIIAGRDMSLAMFFITPISPSAFSNIILKLKFEKLQASNLKKAIEGIKTSIGFT